MLTIWSMLIMFDAEPDAILPAGCLEWAYNLLDTDSIEPILDWTALWYGAFVPVILPESARISVILVAFGNAAEDSLEKIAEYAFGS